MTQDWGLAERCKGIQLVWEIEVLILMVNYKLNKEVVKNGGRGMITIEKIGTSGYWMCG